MFESFKEQFAFEGVYNVIELSYFNQLFLLHNYEVNTINSPCS